MTTIALFLIAGVLFFGFIVVGIQLSALHDSLKVWIQWDAQHRNLLARRDNA